MKIKKTRVLSGVRASHSSLHLGNYLGAIRGMVELQNKVGHETFYMVADLHGITTSFNPKMLHKNRLEAAKDLLAAGIDPEKSAVFLQADVPEHVELAYLLSSVSQVPELMRMPSKKDEYRKYADDGQLKGVSFALLGYPVLMAADILLYKAEKVPIGEDQLPHLEFTRKVARRLNVKYGLRLPVPEAVLSNELRVPSISEKGKKMSKSTPESAIFLNDSYEEIKKKIFGMSTDAGKGFRAPRKHDAVYALFTLVELVIGSDRRRELEKQYLGSGDGVRYSEVKLELVDAIYNLLKPIQTRRRDLDNNPAKLRGILDEGAMKASKVASITLDEIKGAMGLS